MAELSDKEQARLNCTHMMDEFAGGLVHKQRWLTTNFQLLTENKDKSGRLRYQSVSSVAAINDDLDGDGFNHGRVYQLREFKPNDVSTTMVDYTITLCCLLECRKMASNGTFMRLGIAKPMVPHMPWGLSCL
jgi:hypothetical protein